MTSIGKWWQDSTGLCCRPFFPIQFSRSSIFQHKFQQYFLCNMTCLKKGTKSKGIKYLSCNNTNGSGKSCKQFWNLNNLGHCSFGIAASIWVGTLLKLYELRLKFLSLSFHPTKFFQLLWKLILVWPRSNSGLLPVYSHTPQANCE